MKKFEVGKKYTDYCGDVKVCTKKTDKSVWFNGQRYDLKTDLNGNEYTTAVVRVRDFQADDAMPVPEEQELEGKTTIVYKTNLTEIPKNCKDCKCFDCALAQKRTRLGNVTADIDEKYYDKRHKDCPLLEINQ